MKIKLLSRKFGLAAFLLGMLCAAASAQRPGSPLPRQESLLNGLKLLMWNDPAAAKVTVKIRVHAGAAFDPQGKEGAMSMLADDLFPTAEIREFYVEDLGGSLDVTTTYDYIQISATADQDKLLTLLDSLATAVSNPAIDKETTARLKTAQLARIASQTGTSAYVADMAAAHRLYGSFPYGRPILGTAESVQKIDFADLIDLKQRFLTADNATVAISGNIDGNLAYRAARRYLGAWLKSDKRVPSTFRQPEDPKPGMPIINAPEANKSEFRIAMRGVARADKDNYAAAVLAKILDRRFTATQGAKAFVRRDANILPGIVLFGVSDWNLGRIKRDGDKIAVPVTDNYQKLYLDAAVKTEEFDAAKREIVASLAQVPVADTWLDADTYRLASGKPDTNLLQSVTIADVQRVLERLQKEPAAYVLVFSDEKTATAPQGTN